MLRRTKDLNNHKREEQGKSIIAAIHYLVSTYLAC